MVAYFLPQQVIQPVSVYTCPAYTFPAVQCSILWVLGMCVFFSVCVCDQARKCSVSCQNAIETQNHQGFGYTLAFYALNAKIPFCPKTTAGQKMLREKFPYVMAAADAAESTNNHPNSLEFKYTERKVWLSYCCKVQFNSKPVYSVVFTYSSPFHGVEHTWRECSKANTMKF